ncbi:MAG: M28 family peptidase [Candidatus Kapabacteria bacterium]|nr:M28 family peptidase [Candidatus Kapabacteria bacterium]
MKKNIFSLAIIFYALSIVVISRPSDSTILKVVTLINNSNIDNIIKEISGQKPVVIEGNEYIILSRSNFGSLSYLNPIAAKYVHQKFIEYGYNSYYSPFRLYPEMKYDLETVYAVKTGRVNPNNIILFSSSHDSESKSDTLAPGANINASGLAIVLEAARLFTNIETENTIIFASFDDMMQTGYGSYQLCDSLIKLKPNLLRGIYLEALGWSGGVGPVIGSNDTIKNNILLHEALYVSNLLNFETKITSIVKDKITPIYYFSNKANNYEQVYFHQDFSKPYPYMRTTYDIFDNLEPKYLHDNAGIAIGLLALIAGVIDNSLNIIDYPEKSSSIVCPNHAQEYIEIKLSSASLNPSEGYVRLFNVLGECVLSEKIHPITLSYRMNIEYLPLGIYYVRFGDWVGSFVKIK